MNEPIVSRKGILININKKRNQIIVLVYIIVLFQQEFVLQLGNNLH